MVCQARHTKYSEPVAPPFAMPPTQFDVRDLEPSRPSMPSSSDTGIRQKAGVSGILFLPFPEPISGYSMPSYKGTLKKEGADDCAQTNRSRACAVPLAPPVAQRSGSFRVALVAPVVLLASEPQLVLSITLSLSLSPKLVFFLGSGVLRRKETRYTPLSLFLLSSLFGLLFSDFACASLGHLE